MVCLQYIKRMVTILINAFLKLKLYVLLRVSAVRTLFVGLRGVNI